MDRTLSFYSEKLASNSPVPGGGGASAYVASLGTALGQMVCNLTFNKPKYVDSADEMKQLCNECDSIRKELNELVDKDEEAFLPLSKAYKLDKNDLNRDDIMEKALISACRVPLRIMELCCSAADCVDTISEKGSTIVISDAGCAAACLQAALKSAYLNVMINLKGMKDQSKKTAIKAYADDMLNKYSVLCEQILQFVIEKIG